MENNKNKKEGAGFQKCPQKAEWEQSFKNSELASHENSIQILN